MSTTDFFVYLLLMAGVTYLIRAVPLILIRKKIENKYVKSFLIYVPYAVLGSMTFPAIFYSTGDLCSGVAGCTVGVFFAFKKKGLLFVALISCLAAFFVKMFVVIIGI